MKYQKYPVVLYLTKDDLKKLKEMAYTKKWKPATLIRIGLGRLLRAQENDMAGGKDK